MTRYKVQYWIYAVLNKAFGSEVKIHRNSLHRMYEVNRHAMEVVTNTQPIELVQQRLEKRLQEVGYVLDEASGYWVKRWGQKRIQVQVKNAIGGNAWNTREKPVINIAVY